MTQPQEKISALKKLNSKLTTFAFLHGFLLGPICVLLFMQSLTTTLVLSIPAIYIVLEILNVVTNKNILKKSDHLAPEDPLIQKSQTLAATLSIMALISLGLAVLLIIHLIGLNDTQDYSIAFFPGLVFAACPLHLFFKQHRLLARPSDTPKHHSETKFDSKGNAIIPIWQTVLQHDTKVLQTELAKGGDINAPYPANGNTPLHIAAWNGYTEIVKLLLAQPGINKEAKNLAGKTPLKLATEQGHTETAALLEK